jgi:N6-adenosine-specific RNA methylase IME4/ParB-like chromosome segregation protein Spo0J
MTSPKQTPDLVERPINDSSSSGERPFELIRGIHALADLFPLMEGEAFEEFCASIKEHGLLNPIIVSDGVVLDGRNRRRACEKLGIEPSYVEFSTLGLSCTPEEYIWQQNIARRHLTDDQRAVIAVQRRDQISAAAKERQLTGKGADGSGGRGKRKNPPLESAEGLDRGANETRSKLAKMAHVRRNKIDVATKVMSASPALAEKVKSGATTLTAATRELRESKRENRREENRQKVAQAPDPASLLESATRFATIVIDPPWDWGDEGDINQLGRAKPDYATMTFDQVLVLPVDKLADYDSHIYVWSTNRSLPKCFLLLEHWGFRYVTTLCWVKPHYGMGNYFRGQSEHVLFGVRGSQMLKRKDVGTVFHAERGKGHSAKPPEFLDLVESCSPGPYLEMFGRLKRKGWTSWGEDGADRVAGPGPSTLPVRDEPPSDVTELAHQLSANQQEVPV